MGRHIAEKSFSFFWKRSKRKLGRALLCLPHAVAWGFKEFSGNSLPSSSGTKAEKKNSLGNSFDVKL